MWPHIALWILVYGAITNAKARGLNTRSLAGQLCKSQAALSGTTTSVGFIERCE